MWPRGPGSTSSRSSGAKCQEGHSSDPLSKDPQTGDFLAQPTRRHRGFTGPHRRRSCHAARRRDIRRRARGYLCTGRTGWERRRAVSNRDGAATSRRPRRAASRRHYGGRIAGTDYGVAPTCLPAAVVRWRYVARRVRSVPESRPNSNDQSGFGWQMPRTRCSRQYLWTRMAYSCWTRADSRCTPHRLPAPTGFVPRSPT
jgi:hypothetical protein